MTRTYIILISFFLMLSACTGFQKVLNKGKPEDQYKMAMELFEKGKYNRAIQLFEKAIPFYRGKPQMERIQFTYSMANYKVGNYLISGYHFDRFTRNFPRSSKREEAMYLAAHSYYLSSPRYSLDQSETRKAIDALQHFIDSYPESEKVNEANKLIRDLEKRIEKKDYEIAYQYLHTGKYKAAIVAFDNFLSEHLGTKLKEDALFNKAKAAYYLALNSVEKKKEERLKKAIMAFERLKRNFPDSKYTNQTNSMLKKLTSILEQKNRHHEL